MVAMAGNAIAPNAALRAVTLDAGLDRREMEIARQLTFHYRMTINAGDAFLMERVVKFP
jgi:hypothetical protein